MKTFTEREVRAAKALFEYHEGAGAKGDRWDHADETTKYMYKCRARVVLDAAESI